MHRSLGYQVLLAIVAGILAGLFFGQYTHVLEPIGQIYFTLLEMVVLPYIPFMLIHGLGSLSGEIAKKLFAKGWVFFLTVWLVGFGIIYALTYLIPTPQMAFINPNSAIFEGGVSNSITFLVPTNLFSDFANNIIPALTIFGLIGGLSVMRIEKNNHVLGLLEQVNSAIEKVLYWLALFSPIAIFSHMAAASGSLRVENLGKMELFLGIYLVGILLIAFWFFPLLLTSLTSLTYRDVMREFRLVCLIPFATAIPSLAFPFIYLSVKRIAKLHALEGKPFVNTAQTVLPVTFAFGQIGNFFILYFVSFLSFFTHHPLTAMQSYLLPLLTLPLSIGSVFSTFNAVTFFIRQFELPEAARDLFINLTSVTLNFQVLLSVASILTLMILILSAYYGFLKLKLKKLIAHSAIGFGLFALAISFAKHRIHFEDNFTNLYMDLKMSDVMASSGKCTVYREGETIPARSHPEMMPMMRVLKTKVLRVGYFSMDIPFSYFNRYGQLSGYDIAFAKQLAQDLDCALEFIPIDIDRIGEQLKNAEYDVAMSAIVMSEERLTQINFVNPYFEQNNVLIVPANKKEAFSQLDQVSATVGMKIGGMGSYFESVKQHFPNVKAEEIFGFQEFISGEIDAVLWNYLSSFIWCLSHPEFTIVDYEGRLGKRFFSYGVPQNSDQWIQFLQNWMVLKQESGFSKKQYNYWILGQSPQKQQPRWSIMRNVLKWGKAPGEPENLDFPTSSEMGF